MHNLASRMHKSSPILSKLEKQTSDSFEDEDLGHQDRLANCYYIVVKSMHNQK